MIGGLSGKGQRTMATMRAEAKTRTRKLAWLLAGMALALALAVVLGALPAQAATTFTVDTTNDAPDADTTDGLCATAATECTLRAAIEQSNNVDGDDVIVFAPSVSGTIVLGGSHLLINSNLEINGPGADVLSVDANKQSQVFNFYNATAGLSGLTLTGGSSYYGGGIDLYRGTLTISESTITGNTASSGGGIRNDEGTLTVSESTIRGNTATINSGGGIHNDAGTVTVSESTIRGNTAVHGGGISVPYVEGGPDGGSLKVERSTISGNTATQSGGGIRSSTPSVGPFTTDKTTIKNSTISGNTAEQDYGGGVYNNNGITEIENSTITNNTAPAGKGSGVASSGDTSTSTQVYSSIISDNTGTDNTGTDTGTDADFVGGLTVNSFVSEGYNLMGDGNAVTGTGEVTGAFDKTGDQINVTDPGLEPLQLSAPGSTQTHALEAASPALNAGPPASECPATDQRGVARPQEGTCDIGAFEFMDTTKPRVSTPTPTGTGIGRGTNVAATFSEEMAPASITKSTFKLFKVTSSGTTQVTNVTVTLSSDGLKATLNPFGTSSTLLAASTKYKAVVTTSAKDLAGNRLDQNRTMAGNQPKTWTFTTRG